MPKLSIIIISFNTARLTLAAVSSVLADAQQSKLLKEIEILVVDNASKDDSVNQITKLLSQSSLSAQQWQVMANAKNVGFAQANNQAVTQASGNYILLLNSDTEVAPNATRELLTCIESAEANTANLQLLAARLINPDGSYQNQGGDIPSLASILGQWWFFSSLPLIGASFPSVQRKAAEQPLIQPSATSPPFIFRGWVAGTALLLRKNTFQQLGGFDEQQFMYGEDVDLCWRATQRGWRAAICPHATVMHHGSASSTSHRARMKEVESMLYLWRKHRGRHTQLLVRTIIASGSLIRFVAHTLLGHRELATTYSTIIKQLLLH